MHLSKKALIIGFTIIMLLGCAGISTAYEDSQKTIEFDISHFYYNYNEVDSGTSEDSEKGWLNGMNFTFKNQDQDTKEYWQLSFNHTKDDTKYDGSYLETGTPCQSTTKDELTSIELDYGFPIAENTYFLIGLGYHYWDRVLSEDQDEKYSWLYIPIGFRWEHSFNKQLDAAIEVTAKFMMAGQMTSTITDYQDFTVDLGNKPGYKIDLPLTYHFNSNWALAITPWYEYSSIGESNMVQWYYANGFPTGYEVYEPDSSTKQNGINIGIRWDF
ncbi:MAG TPA: hypothetical protein DDW50_14900 [Firmicutes bacterium]|nr:hypothetical protein [Bacillota bacterium]